MEIFVDISMALNIAGTSIGLLLSFIFVRRKVDNQTTNFILSFLLFAFSFMIFNSVIIFAGYAGKIPFYEDVSNSLILTVTPLIFCYIAFSTDADFNSKTIKFHLIPFLAYFGFVAFNHISGIISDDIRDIVEGFFYIGSYLQISTYLILSFRKLNRYKLKVKSSYSYTEDIDKTWIKTALYMFTLVFIIITALTFYTIFVSPTPEYISLNVILLLSFSIFYLGYIKLSRTEKNIELIKYESSTLSREDSKKYIDILQRSMDLDRLFLNPNLTIKDLSDHLGIQSRHISQVINQELNKNFYDFVNFYRVEDSKQKIPDPKYQNLTLIGIATESGFKSGSAFNMAFKKHTGKTPSAFKMS